MGGANSDEMGFQHRGQGSLNCPSSDTTTNPMSEKISGMTMNSLSTYKSSNRADPFFASGWDPLASLSQNHNFGGSSMVSHSEFAHSTFPGVLQNQGMSSTSHLVQYPSDSRFGELVPKLPCFGSGGFSDMVGSFSLSDCAQITTSGCPPNYAPNKETGNERPSTNGGQSQEDHQISEEGSMAASPDGMRRKRVLESTCPFNPNKNVEGDLQKDVSGENSEGEKKQKIEQSTGTNLRGKQAGKQTKDNSNSGDGAKDNYIHVRARRGQATNSHSLAERVRREKISERMRLLQELVPGCNKITGKAVMLDEIINYVQSLQQQVEFLSMKLATVNPELNIDIERILSKDVFHSRSGGAAILGYGPGMSSSQPYPHGIFQGTLSGIQSATPHYPPLSQTVLDTELQNLFQMGYDPNSAIDNLGPNGRLKSEL